MISRLKSLELHGYKTFASRTNFEFPGTITAVVGPNGSGKSNIADAIRWVLGEQSYSLLRGRKTEDMIFAGSEMRPRASMASASITFDNEDGWLPIDYTEVSIARRAYRDGQNEYILNGQRVRLKEISELLAQSGLAERTYTIIGQGLVDAALSLKPEERRRFFEEAAGIGLYRSRREEALARLETTRRNLERVHDILAELEPRLRSLEKQAAKAIEYERIKGELRMLLREWYGYYWHRTQQDFTKAREILAVHEERLQQARDRLLEVEKRLKTKREEIQSVRSELSAWHLQSAELHNQREKISRDLAVLDERQRALTDQIRLHESDLTRLEEEQKAQQGRLELVRAEREEQEKTYLEALSQREAAQGILDELTSTRQGVETDLQEKRRKLAALQTRQVEIQAQRNELQHRVDSLQKDRQRLQQGLEPSDIAVREAHHRLENAQQVQEKSQAERLDLETKLTEISEKIKAAEGRYRQLQEKLAVAQANISQLNAQIEVLTQAELSHSGLNQGTRLVLSSAERGGIRGRFFAINKILEVPAEYENAVAAALGDFLDAIALEAEEDAEKALEMLVGTEKGRAILLPLTWLKPEKRLTSPADSDCLGVAAELVNKPDSLGSLVDLLLGQVLVVTNRAAARKLAAQQEAHVRVVTLAGEVFYGSGIVAAGQESRTSLISRPRQLRELQARRDEQVSESQQLQKEADKQAKTLEKFRSEQAEVEGKLAENARMLADAVKMVHKASLDYEQARQKADWQKSQVEELSARIANGIAEISSLAEGDERTSLEQSEVEKQIRALELKLEEIPLDEPQAQVFHWRTQAAIHERVLKESEQREKEFAQRLASSQAQAEVLRKRQKEAGEQLQQLDQDKNLLREKELLLNTEIDELRSLIEPAEARLAGLETQYERILADQAAAQQNLAVSERHASQAQLEMTRIRDSLENLQRRIEEDFGLVAFEYQGDISGPTPLPFEGMVEQLPTIIELPTDLEDNINRQRSQLRRIGAVNPEAQQEYLSVKERYEFLSTQVVDLKKADEDLREVIAELDALMKKEFLKTFDLVASEFKVNFTRLFGGGSARLVLHDGENPTETGIDIEARLPGRREQGLSLLSGGERSLTAVALIFSLLKVSPTPFCVLDEVDAMLDEANVGRFTELLVELSQNTQFIVITHNRNTVQVADVIYGVTMSKDTASQVISLRLDEVTEELAK